jgi:prepilin-type N-terminal cleavage/methylation domain-containing protein
MHRFVHPAGSRSSFRKGFSLVELLASMGIIAILASLLLPALARGRAFTKSLSCMNNMKQLQLGWQIYADDFNDVLPPNRWSSPTWNDGCPQGYQSASGTWVTGDCSSDPSEWPIRNGVLFPYIERISLYRCPADNSKVDGVYPRRQRTRSYSLSFYMNGSANNFGWQVKSKFSQISSPSSVFTFIEEHPNSIDDGVFFFHCPGDAGEQVEQRDEPNKYGGAHWMNVVTDRHRRGLNLDFADGHAESWYWKWPKYFPNREADRDIENDLDYKDYQRIQAALPEPNVPYEVFCGRLKPGVQPPSPR